MKRIFAFLLTLTMVATCAVYPAMATNVADMEENVQEVNGVHIPLDATCVQEGNATVYYDFYDSVNHMHYAFYNVVTGEHFAISDPYEVDVETDASGARGRKHTAHDYSFSTTSCVYGNLNKVFFDLPATTVYISGTAETKRMADGSITSNDYEDGCRYTITVKQDKFFGKNEEFLGIAGKELTGDFQAAKGEYYMNACTSIDMNDGEYLEGSGSLYYY